VAIEVVHEANSPLANSFISLAEYAYYHERRLPLEPPVATIGDVAARNVIMATRLLSGLANSRCTLRFDSNGKPYYYMSCSWTGSVATTTQALSWGRIGMIDSLGRVIAENVIPQELKNATAELAGQLGSLGDRTLDNDIALQGITSIKAGSVALTFKDMIQSQVMPDAVLALIPSHWLNCDSISYVTRAPIFEAV
jgi:hypothetical protein